MSLPAYWLVVPAAGRGTRYGGGTPKQYLALAGSTVLEHALAPFLADPHLSGAVVAIDPGDRRFAALALARDPRVRSVPGGAARAESVDAGLAAVQAAVGPLADPWVMVHDAARPLVTPVEIHLLLEALATSPDGALLGSPVTDTIKRVDGGGRVESTVDRSVLWRALTPQAFRLQTLLRALAAARATGRVPTDEASAVEALGARPCLVPGSAANLKITAPGDLSLAEFLLGERRAVLARGAEPRV